MKILVKFKSIGFKLYDDRESFEKAFSNYKQILADDARPDIIDFTNFAYEGNRWIDRINGIEIYGISKEIKPKLEDSVLILPEGTEYREVQIKNYAIGNIFKVIIGDKNHYIINGKLTESYIDFGEDEEAKNEFTVFFYGGTNNQEIEYTYQKVLDFRNDFTIKELSDAEYNSILNIGDTFGFFPLQD